MSRISIWIFADETRRVAAAQSNAADLVVPVRGQAVETIGNGYVGVLA